MLELQLQYDQTAERVTVEMKALSEAWCENPGLTLNRLRQRRDTKAMLFQAFQARRSGELRLARRLLQGIEAASAGPHELEIMDLMVVPEYVQEAFELVKMDDVAQEARRLIVADFEASSQVRSNAWAAGVDRKLRGWFAEAAGRTIEEGPPPASGPQPGLEPRLLSASDLELAAWFVRFAGYRNADDVDEHGWTPLHHAMQSTVHWDEGHRVCRGLMQMMDPARLGAKTTGGRIVSWTALHMCANGSDCQLQRAALCQLLLQRGVDIDPLDEQGRSPFLICCGTGAVDTAKALSQGGADVRLASYDGRNAANRAKESSGEMSRCDVVIVIFFGAGFDFRGQLSHFIGLWLVSYDD